MQTFETSPKKLQASAASSIHSRKPASRNIPIQASLPIGQPGDAYEVEADQIAAQVMRMPAQTVQRKCTACEEEEIQTKPLASTITPLVQTKGTGVQETPAWIESQINEARGGGNPLPDETRSFMEGSIGADFSGVKVHTGSHSEQLNRSLNAQAFTVGNDVFFGAGKFSPNTSEGKGLLAHELTHVVQQNAGIQTKRIQRVPARLVGCDPGPLTTSSGAEIANPTDFITTAETRAIELIDAALDEMTFTRDQIRAGAEPGWPTIGDTLAFALRLTGINPDSRSAWTGNGVGTVALLARRLRGFRGTLVGGGVFYHCDPQTNVNMSPCTPINCSGGGADAFSCAGSFRIILCDPFWTQPLLDERAVILIHEHAHNFAQFIQDAGREGNAECYSRFVIEANGLTATPQSVGLCPNP